MKWIESIDLNPIILEMSTEYHLENLNPNEDCPEEVKKKLAEEIRKSSILFDFSNDILDSVSIHDVNMVLSDLFDYADFHKVWCGL